MENAVPLEYSDNYSSHDISFDFLKILFIQNAFLKNMNKYILLYH